MKHFQRKTALQLEESAVRRAERVIPSEFQKVFVLLRLRGIFFELYLPKIIGMYEELPATKEFISGNFSSLTDSSERFSLLRKESLLILCKGACLSLYLNYRFQMKQLEQQS